MFVLLPGRSRAEAFRIGEEIARAVTAANPPPVTLKMEKVRGGRCVLAQQVFKADSCTQADCGRALHATEWKCIARGSMAATSHAFCRQVLY